MTRFQEKKDELLRKGAIDKVKWLENIDKNIMPSNIKRIQQNDKTVLREIVVPSWVSWDLLHDWALSKKGKAMAGKTCILCNNDAENGMYYLEKYICENCFLKIKGM